MCDVEEALSLSCHANSENTSGLSDWSFNSVHWFNDCVWSWLLKTPFAAASQLSVNLVVMVSGDSLWASLAAIGSCALSPSSGLQYVWPDDACHVQEAKQLVLVLSLKCCWVFTFCPLYLLTTFTQTQAHTHTSLTSNTRSNINQRSRADPPGLTVSQSTQSSSSWSLLCLKSAGCTVMVMWCSKPITVHII